MAILEWGQGVDTTLEMLKGVEEELIARSFLFSDPVSYREGVGAATQAVRAMLESSRVAGRKEAS